jgi:hypothetical protein
MREVLFIAFVLACPLMMMWMTRGGHGHGHGAGHGGRSHGGHDEVTDAKNVSTQDLRRQRDELDRQIEQREQWEPQPEPEPEPERELEPTAWGRR